MNTKYNIYFSLFVGQNHGLSNDYSQYSYYLAIFKCQFLHDFVIQSYISKYFY